VDRETFKILAYGQFAYTHMQDTIDKDQMRIFVDGAIWAYDLAKKKEIEEKRFFPKAIEVDPFIYSGTIEHVRQQQ